MEAGRESMEGLYALCEDQHDVPLVWFGYLRLGPRHDPRFARRCSQGEQSATRVCRAAGRARHHAPEYSAVQRGVLDDMRPAEFHCARRRSRSVHPLAASARCESILRRGQQVRTDDKPDHVPPADPLPLGCRFRRRLKTNETAHSPTTPRTPSARATRAVRSSGEPTSPHRWTTPPVTMTLREPKSVQSWSAKRDSSSTRIFRSVSPAGSALSDDAKA